jgi:DNA-binding PadR family transcriptional regulator
MTATMPGSEAGRPHHPHDHRGRDRFDGPRHGGHMPPGGGFGGPFGGPFEMPPGGGRGFGPRDGGRRRGRHGRAGRGEVRSAILKLLAEEPMHGYQLMQAVADRTGGAWRLSPGAVYPTIAQLEDEGLVQVTVEGGRKLVTLTEAGRAHVETLGDADPFAAFGEAGDRVDLRGAIGELMGATHQLARVGDPTQLAAAAGVLAEARRSLYLILAGDAPTGTTDESVDEQEDTPTS